jgi:hypothetical protein
VSDDYEPVTVEEALRLARERSWTEWGPDSTCGHTGCEDHRSEGRKMIHTYGSFGCDLSLEDVEKRIHAAKRIVWADHLLRHDLAIEDDGRWLSLDVPNPKRGLVTR